MRDLINDVLAYSRLDAHGKKFAPVDMNAVIAEVLTTLRETIEENKADVTVDPLPTVAADESQMMQVMQNLIGNALKFHGPDRPIIRISSSPEEREWTISVKDNGIGLDMADAEKIFLMFQRLNNRDEYPGTGIGLAVAKKIVERHGGRIWVESKLGKGATFFFTIPTADTRNGKRNHSV
jgi:chemotaxis family two-component system sensor kinase Cph1